MKLLFASDSFKGSLTSEETAVLLEKAAEEVFGKCEVSSAPVADGGEGTVEAVIAAEKGKKI
ncbi:MAG: glycerate kinase, partial [Solobacterium sp.]|nr:glycerate kinase [Solobacterium sp.]